MADYTRLSKAANEGPKRRKRHPNNFFRDWGPAHCDPAVLHAPGECSYCDLYPEAQLFREMWGINYTGWNELNKLPCPAEARRDVNVINKWVGNTPEVPEDFRIPTKAEIDNAVTVLQQVDAAVVRLQ